MTELGPLGPLDELLAHQIVDTFATVSQADRSWTEKICAMACARDGAISLGFGLGKYPNRNVMDAYAGVSRGTEQWTVRASRELGADNITAVGPIRYEVIEPMERIRFTLAANETQPVAFEWNFTGVVPAVLENHEVHRARDGRRVDADIARYHHIGTAHGWVEVDGERTEFDDGTWVSTRDHSWGVRYQVGVPVTDIAPAPVPAGVATTVIWSPILMTRTDGTTYGLHTYYQRHAFGDWSRVELQGGFEHADGRREPYAALVPELDVDPQNRRLRGGVLHATMTDGTPRDLTVTALSATGFHLGAGLYFGFDDHWHGEWRGAQHVDGEHIADCTTFDAARRLHQLRDCIVRVEDRVGGGVGIGNLQSLFSGPHPELGLDQETSFM
jgi:hypothetical protein